MKEILLYVQPDPTIEKTLETALALTRACGGHLHCIHAVPILSYLSFSGFSTVAAIEEQLKAFDKLQDDLRANVEEQLDTEDVSWSYEKDTGDVVDSIVARAALADLVVVSRGDPAQKKGRGDRMSVLGDLIQRLRTPIYITGDQEEIVDPSGPAVISWDGSYEAANAVRGAIDLLQLASSVTALRISERKADLFPNTRLLKYLARHGIEAELIEEAFSEDWVSKVLKMHAARLDAGYIVAGGYGHSRIGEFIFGGTTRELLTACPVGALLAH